MNKADWWSSQLLRPGQNDRDDRVLWSEFWKTLLAFGAVVALMGGVLYAETALMPGKIAQIDMSGD